MAGERDKLHVQSIGGRTVSNDSFVGLRFDLIRFRFVVRIFRCFCLRTDFSQQSLTTESGAMCRRTTISRTRLTNYQYLSFLILPCHYTPNANMADLSVGPGLVARKRG